MAKTNKTMSIEELKYKAIKKAGLLPKPSKDQLEDLLKTLQ